ncbi:MAG: hypothetical protein ABSC04_01540 [Syntrophobacteraceae bacterium]|jgi:hypothetical protein
MLNEDILSNIGNQKDRKRVQGGLKRLMADPWLVDLRKINGVHDRWRLRVGDWDQPWD